MSCQPLFLRLVLVYSDCRARAFGLPQVVGLVFENGYVILKKTWKISFAFVLLRCERTQDGQG